MHAAQDERSEHQHDPQEDCDDLFHRALAARPHLKDPAEQAKSDRDHDPTGQDIEIERKGVNPVAEGTLGRRGLEGVLAIDFQAGLFEQGGGVGDRHRHLRRRSDLDPGIDGADLRPGTGRRGLHHDPRSTIATDQRGANLPRAGVVDSVADRTFDGKLFDGRGVGFLELEFIVQRQRDQSRREFRGRTLGYDVVGMAIGTRQDFARVPRLRVEGAAAQFAHEGEFRFGPPHAIGAGRRTRVGKAEPGPALRARALAPQVLAANAKPGTALGTRYGESIGRVGHVQS